MGEVIRLEEIDRERRRSRARVAERAHLERAVALLRENLASAAEALRHAPNAPAQTELLGRIERFAARATGLMARLSQVAPSPDVRARGQQSPRPAQLAQLLAAAALGLGGLEAALGEPFYLARNAA